MTADRKMTTQYISLEYISLEMRLFQTPVQTIDNEMVAPCVMRG